MDLVTVIVPIYNVEKYLERCLDSIINQTYNNLEILLINDGSPDRSDIIMERYANNDKRIRCIYKKNGGQGTARNIGIYEAKGDYICFVDSDDDVSLEYVEKLYNSIKENESDISWCNINIIDNNNCKRKISQNEDDIWAFDLPSPCNKLFKKSLFINNNIFFPGGIKYEDLGTIPFIFYYSKSISWVNEELYNYYSIDNSTTRKFDRRLLDIKKILQIFLVFLENNNIKNDHWFYEIVEYIFLYNMTSFVINMSVCKDFNLKDIKSFVSWIEDKFKNIYENNIAKRRMNFMRKGLIFLIRMRMFFIIRIIVRILF